MYPASLHTILTQTIDSSQIFERRIFQKQQKNIEKMKSWDENTIKDLEQVCPKQAHDFHSRLLFANTVLPNLILSSRLIILW